MVRYILGRLLQSIITLFVLSLIVFLLSRAIGDPIGLMLPMEVPFERIDAIRHSLGLDRPLYVQYGVFLRDIVRGELGNSIYTGLPVLDTIVQRLPNSAKLATCAVLLATVIALPLGIIGAVKRGTPFDTGARTIAIFGQSVAQFWLGIMLIAIFSVQLGWLPVSGMGGIDHYILPSIALGFFLVAGISRLLRSSMLDVLDSDFIKLARMKGISERLVLWKHALRNSLLPVLGFAGIYFAILMTSAIVVESVFAWPGIGRLAYQSIMTRDYPLLQGVVLLMGFVVVTGNLVVDLLYAWVDPRIRYE